MAKRSMPQSTAEEKPKTTKIYGKVVGCSLLNVREKASFASAALCVIPVGAKVVLDMKNSTEEFYKVKCDIYTGYCMKKFIEVIPNE